MRPTPSSSFIPGTRLDRYVLHEVLGEGGLAVVYRATHVQLGTTHAVKVLKTPSASIRRRLLLEGRVQAQLQHPNVVAVTDVIDVQGAPGLVMEFVEGRALDEFLARRRLTLDEADLIARGILAGVAAAHARGLVHRDLKPANILLKPENGGLVPKITDFGLAKVLEGEPELSRTRSGVAMGTPAYMAPEQVRDAKTVDQRADIFALGAILYELLAGRKAFDGDGLLMIFNQVANVDAPPLATLAPDAPERMMAAIGSSLVADPDGRFESAAKLLEAWCAGTPPPTGVWTGAAIRLGIRTDVPPQVRTLSDSGAVYEYADADGAVGPGDTYGVDRTFGMQPTARPLEARAVGPANDDETLMPAPPAVQQPSAKRGWWLAGSLVLAVVGLLGLTLVAGLLWQVSAPTAGVPVQAAPAPPEARPIRVPEREPEPAPQPEPAPEVVPEPEPQVVPVPPPDPVQASPVPPRVRTGKLVAEGAVVQLIREGRRYGAGAVPAGTYRAVARFDDAEVELPRPVVVEAGKTVRLTCSPGFYTCRVE